VRKRRRKRRLSSLLRTMTTKMKKPNGVKRLIGPMRLTKLRTSRMKTPLI